VIDCSTGVPPDPAHVLVNDVCPTIPPSCALIVVVPQPTAVARPDELIVATLVALEDHVTAEPRLDAGRFVSLVVPSASNWIVCPVPVTVAAAGVTAIDTSRWLLQLTPNAKQRNITGARDRFK
jgi:hypothetical protein